MKKLIIICSLLATTGSAFAQVSATNEKENNTHSSWSGTRQNDDFANTEMKFHEGGVIFTDLPQLSGKIWVLLTNSNGEFIRKKQITPADNSLGTSGLRDGALYFVTIMYHNKARKAFTLNH